MYFDSLKLEKGMYNQGFTKTLESLDPSANYENTAFSGLDAFERQLKRFGIKVSGANSSTVGDFFANIEAAVLFPEFVKRAVQQGIEESSVLSAIIATTTLIDGNDYRTLKNTTENTSGNIITEGSVLPETTLINQSTLVTMKKRGRLISTSYEALRLKRLDLFAVMLKQIGAEIARAQLSDAVSVLVSGDGNNNAAATVIPVSASGVAYQDLVALWASLAPFDMNVMLANATTMQALLQLSEMRDATAGLSFQGTGKMITPLGATLIREPNVGTRTIIALDKNCALEMVLAGEICLDNDKLIEKQLERIAISSTAGFAKIFKDAAKTMQYVATT